ncbi:MAG: cation:proton antiporter [Candidatus Hadarchaeales archaeon]
MDPVSLLGALSLMIIVGVASDWLFRRAMVPDTIPLILLGILLGPGLGILPSQSLKPLAPVVGSLSLIVILLDQGMKLSYVKLLKGAPRAILLAFSTFLFSVLLIAPLAHVLLNLSPLLSLALGAILGGTSSVIIAPLVEKLEILSRIKTLLLIDSVITDILCIVSVLALCTLVAPSPAEVGRNLATTFLSAAALGTLVGICWLPLSLRFQGIPFSYSLLLAVSFCIYAVTETLGASGGLAVLAFGLTLGNASKLGRMLRLQVEMPDPEVRRFHGEVTFMVRTFFLVYLGSMFDRGFLPLLPGSFAIFLACVVARMLSAKVTCFRDPQLGQEEVFIGLMLPKGLAAAVLSYLPYQYGYAEASSFPSIVLSIILFTNLLSMVATLRRR